MRVIGKVSSLPRFEDRLLLGDCRVSPICVGITGDHNVVCEAYDAGINFFFVSADMHWPLYENTRRGLQRLFERTGVRDDVVVAGVSYVTQPEFCVAPFAELVNAVPRMGKVDVAVAGGAYRGEFLGRLPVYQAHRRRETSVPVRGTGVSVHDLELGRLTASAGLVDVVYVRYSAQYLHAQYVFKHLAEGAASLLYCFKSTMGWRAESVVKSASGVVWLPKVTDHYRFVLTGTPLDGVLCSLAKPSMVAELADALAQGPLEEEQWHGLVALAGGGRDREM